MRQLSLTSPRFNTLKFPGVHRIKEAEESSCIPVRNSPSIMNPEDPNIGLLRLVRTYQAAGYWPIMYLIGSGKRKRKCNSGRRIFHTYYMLISTGYSKTKFWDAVYLAYSNPISTQVLPKTANSQVSFLKDLWHLPLIHFLLSSWLEGGFSLNDFSSLYSRTFTHYFLLNTLRYWDGGIVEPCN